MPKALILATFLLIAAPLANSANVGKCVAADGSFTLTDSECPPGSKMAEIYDAPSNPGPGTSARSEQRRALRMYESIPERPSAQSAPITGRPSSEYMGPKSSTCVALLAQKKQIESRMRTSGYSIPEGNRLHAELKQINEKRCRNKCISC